MMHLLRKNDVAPLRSAMMRCLPQCAVRHTSLGVAVIIDEVNIICRRQTSFKKVTFVLADKSDFFVGAGGEMCLCNTSCFTSTLLASGGCSHLFAKNSHLGCFLNAKSPLGVQISTHNKKRTAEAVHFLLELVERFELSAY